MKIGVSAFGWNASFEPADFDILTPLRQHGVEAFEVPIFDPAQVAADTIRKALEENHLECTVCAILPAGINPISPDAAERRKAQAHLVRCIQTADALGARLIGGPLYAPIGYLPGRRRTEDEWRWAVEGFQSLGDTLAKYEMTMALEPVNRSETFFLTTISETAELCEAIGNPAIGVLIDTFHANIEEKDIARAIFALGPRLKHIHASENDRGTPGSGHIDFVSMIAALRQIHYDGYLMIEGLGRLAPGKQSPIYMWRRPDESGDAIAWEGAAYLRKLLQ
jgi:D-psicose/D-tagatose/L-ribulose 3-epimerase